MTQNRITIRLEAQKPHPFIFGELLVWLGKNKRKGNVHWDDIADAVLDRSLPQGTQASEDDLRDAYDQLKQLHEEITTTINARSDRYFAEHRYTMPRYMHSLSSRLSSQ